VDVSGIGKPLPKDYERAVIRVHFSDDFFTDRLEKNVGSLTDAEYYLMDQSGGILISGGDFSGFVMQPEWWEQIREKGSGMLTVGLNGGAQAILCFDRLVQSGWTSLAVFSVNTLANGLTTGLYATFIGVVTVQVITSVLATLLAVSIIGKRIKRLNQGVDALKAGNFATQIKDNRQDEFTYLVQNFNGMSVTLRQLIDENYKVRLSEQEARLQTLMMQFNPHFLYNTLNVINWVALRGNTKKASALIVSLSRMLRYTCDNRQERTKFADDMEWLKQYLMLMDARFEGLFTVVWDVEEECFDLELPKLFMQPLLENSILHGFGDRKHGGEIQIRARMTGGDVICEVQDNGVGMTKEQAERVLKVEGESIGLYNTNKRIQLMFGEGYGLTIESSAGGGCMVRVLMCAV
jgi:two-component system sensor histidine kinase YesM